MCLCRSKSQKLAFAFDLMDEDKDGGLSRRELWRYFRSFLCVILCLSASVAAAGGGGVLGLVMAADDAAKHVADSLWRARDCDSEAPPGVSFDALAEWYGNDGFKIAPWLELLDSTKWPLFVSM